MPNESRGGNSSFGDGIYYREREQVERNQVESSTLLSIRKRLLDEYIKSKIEDEHDECGCHFGLDTPSDDLKLLDELDKCYRKLNATNEELRSVSPPTSKQPRRRRQRRRPQQSSKRAKQSEPRERARQQQVTSVTREGSAFTRLITPATTDEPEGTRPLCESIASVGEDEASVGSTAAAAARLAYHPPVAHRHRQRKSAVVSNGQKRQQQHYGISEREQRTRLFIDDSESVQSSSVAPGGCCCCWQCFAENNNNNYESSNNSGGGERNIARREIYEPRPEQPPGAAAATLDAGHRRSWPCYSNQASTGQASRAHQAVRGNSSIRFARDTSILRKRNHPRANNCQFFITRAPQGEESASASGEESGGEDLDKFDTRSALDCVEEFSPTWSDLSSVQIGDSDQVPNSREEDELVRGASASNLASWIQLQKMEEGGKCESQERNNNNVASERQFGCDLNRPDYEELEARPERARPSSPGQEKNYFASYQTNQQELDEKREAPDEEPRRTVAKQIKGKTKTSKSQQQEKARRKKKRKREEEEAEADLSNCSAASEQQQLEQQATAQSECESASMRAARDLAKLSVPSLSSLQYLPGQLDVKPAKMVDRKVKSPPARSSTSAGSCRRASPASLSAAPRISSQEIDGPQSISAHARETAEIDEKHDDSCLLERLCMCNCMAGKRPKSVDAAESFPTSQPRTAAATRGTSPKGSRASSCAEACASPVSLSESVDLHADEDVVPPRVDSERDAPSTARAKGPSLAPRAGGNVVNVRDDALSSRGSGNSEKQSPTFLGLLGPAAARSGGGVKKHKTSRGHPLEAAPTATRVQPSKGFGVASSKVLGSIDDLEASGRSSSSASGSQAASDFCSPPLSSRSSSSSKFAVGKFERPRLLHKQSGIESDNILSEQENTSGGGGKIETPLCRKCNSPTGANREENPRRSKPAYKRILSPSKLFHNSSQNSHSSICEDCKPAADAAPSFLSRSLSRLSGKPPAGKHNRSSPVPPTSEQDPARSEGPEQQLPAGLSPSASNHSHLDTYCSDSINSLEEEINLCHSLPYEVNLRDRPEAASKNSTRLLRTPEIVLSRVEYEDLQEEEELECSCQERMTRSTSGLGQQRHLRSNGRHSSCRNHDHHLYERAPPPPPPQRHGSEISFQTTSDGSASLTHGPFSLPASPRASRRHRHLSRSPRLSASPVPFHSPASEATKIEDGLKVCSTGHFEKHIGNIKGNQIEAQKRLFTAWINHYAPNLIVRDLFVELQDGIKLIGLLATLTRDRRLLTEYERLNRDKRTYVNRLALTPSSRLTHISNVHIAIDYMRTNLGMKLVNLNPMDIVSGKENVILGLCWNIILHFQLSRDLLGGGGSGSEASSSCSVGGSSSRLSVGRDRGARKPPGGRGQAHLVDELSSKDLVTARGKLLAHINKRFELKLTNLSSSLLDGDVLLAIIRRTVLPANSSSLRDDSRLSSWPALNDNEKLDVCFQLAQDYLNVPWLISGADLRRETLDERNSKPLLVYLSMLLKANPRDCSTDQMLELRQLDESLRGAEAPTAAARAEQEEEEVTPTKQQVSCDMSEKRDPSGRGEPVQDYLNELDTEDKFHVDKLQSTLAKLGRLDQLIESTRASGCAELDEAQLDRIDKLKRQAEQVDSLIGWINEADKLFEAKQEASCDLARTTELYDQSVAFFSPSNLPRRIDASLCPTLERQYRECLEAARQHILSLEQIMKNWTSHREATRELKDWLIRAELKLESALRPNGHLATGGGGQIQENLEFGSDERVDRHKSRLDDLIEFFELEQIDVDDLDMLSSPLNNNPFASLDAGGRSSSLSNFDQTDHSLSGSLLSLGSTGSRVSTLASSKKAAHHRLFDNLELQSHLLAAMLEPEQRDSILTGVKTFNLRMKQILEYKVPQVISDICLSINRCKMQIKEQEEELASEPELEELAAVERAESSIEHEQQPLVCDSISRPESPIALVPTQTVKVSPSPTQTSSRNNSPPVSHSKSSKRQKRKAARGQQQSRNSNNQKHESQTTTTTTTKIKKINILGKVSATACNDADECEPFYRALWHKIVRASRMSLSFNIVLLICLAGVCVVPLIQKDACCELSQAPIPTERFTVNQRPT